MAKPMTSKTFNSAIIHDSPLPMGSESVCVATFRGYILTPPSLRMVDPVVRALDHSQVSYYSPYGPSRDLYNYCHFATVPALAHAREGTFSRTFRVSSVCVAVPAMRLACSILIGIRILT